MEGALSVNGPLETKRQFARLCSKKPVQEYKRESFSMFTLLLETINVEMVKALCSVSIEQKQERLQDEGAPVEKTQTEQPSPQQAKPNPRPSDAQQPKRTKKIGRNEPLSLWFGKKIQTLPWLMRTIIAGAIFNETP